MSVRGWSWPLVLNLGVKISLVGLLLFAVLNPDMQQFQGKADLIM